MIPPKRGATINPTGRFEKLDVEIDPEFDDPNPRTVYLRDDSRSLITYNDSPDISFNASLNPYRGCEHGCAYCYARPYHEYLGFSAGLDFETRIMVKPTAPALLRRELSAKTWRPQPLAMSGVTDCYQPVERKLQITRGCLEVLAEFRNPVGLVTKNHLITRDLDLLSRLAAADAVAVFLSITTLDPTLARRLEPRASAPAHRLDAIRQLSQAGIPVSVLVAPVLPGITEHEIPAILHAAREAGAVRAGYTMLRLPYGVKDVFSAWLDEHLPGAKEKVLGRIQEVRGGRLNDSTFGVRLRGEGVLAEQIRQLFEVSVQREGLTKKATPLSVAAFRRPGDEQLALL